MKHLEKIAVVSAIALLFPLSASGTSYNGFADCIGSCYHADISGITGYDDMRRYPESVSSVIQYIGWATVAPHTSSRTDDPLSYYLKHLPNKRRSGYNRSWLFDSEKRSQGSSGWFPEDNARGRKFQAESFGKYTVEDETDPDGVSNSDTWRHDEYGAGLSIDKVSDQESIGFPQASVQPVPEPGTMLLMGLGMFGMAYAVRSRRQWS